VFENIAYPLKLKKVSKTDQQDRVRRIANTMGIGDLLDRRPGQLSDGQQQRVALGRALVKEPDILLFDEPRAKLESRLRMTMRGEIKHLQKRLGITSIFVTHDQVEALTMADRIAIMHKGELQAFDTPENLYERSKTLFIAGFIGNPPMNLIDMDVAQTNGDFTARTEGLTLTVPTERGEVAAKSEKVKLGIRAEDITVVESSAESDVVGEVFLVEPLGRDDLLDIRIGAIQLYALAEPDKRIRPGDKVHLRFNTSGVQFFDAKTERSLLWN